MFVIKNAVLNISRSIGRNVLIAIIIVTIIASSAIALSISNAANAARVAGLENLQITGNIQFNRNQVFAEQQENQSGEPSEDFRSGFRNQIQDSALSFDDYLKFTELPGVSSYFYTDSAGLNSASESLEAVSSSSNESNETGGRSFNVMGMFGISDFNLTGFSDDQAVTKAQDGTFTMTEGEVFPYDSADNNVIINSQLAIYNSLNVGDKIQLANPNNAEEIYELNIVGIYQNNNQSNPVGGGGGMNNMVQDPANAIYTNYKTLEAIIANSVANKIDVQIEVGSRGSFGPNASESGQEPEYIDGTSELTSNIQFTYVFDSKEDYDAFVAAKDSVVLDGDKDIANYTVASTDLTTFESSLVPLENLSNFALTMLYIILGVGAVILVVVNLINIRDRKYEIGVYTAMGISKPKVVLGFATELLIVALVSVGIGSSIAAVSSVPVANAMLSNQISSMENQSESEQTQFGRGMISGENGPDQFGGGGNNSTPGGGPEQTMGNNGFSWRSANVSYVDQLNATMNFAILGQLLGIAILLSILSSVGGTVSVVRYEPLQILSDRS
ncbi:MAG: ABC transporter permease [Bifidobacteriaceae bacterium]|jgi:putative ABC transport system permease protein|nr:ABC transporter permease [Bifidobacteriaceae bacterium]